ncbi:MAG: hypothetical protein K2X27_06680 [Candidatus Obscuribacterales bacterium]|nr:hypothetical protein [Candidatus Obscuribacterales bacterium]
MEDKWTGARRIGKDVCKHFEGCHLVSYILKGETWATIGWGTAIPLSQHPRKITQAEADQMFDTAFARKEACLRKEIPAAVLDKLSASALGALLSFRYNMKDQVWLSPKCNTRLSLAQGNMTGFWIWHSKWVNGEAGPLAGLKRRRKVEKDLASGVTLESIKKANWYQGQF